MPLPAALLVLHAALASPGACFTRGDFDQDGRHDITDAIGTLSWLFADGPVAPCLDAVDTNDDGAINIADAIASLRFLFSGGSPPPLPHPDCGDDATPDALGCGAPGACAGAAACDGKELRALLRAGGRPLSGETLGAAFIDSDGGALGAAEIETDAGGQAVFAPPQAAAEIVLRALVPGLQPGWAHAGPGTGQVTLELLPAVVVAGTVVDGSGWPVAGARIQALPHPELAGHATISAADGTFVLPHLPSLPEALEVASAEHAPATRRLLAESVAIRLEAGLTLRGTIADAVTGTRLRARLRCLRQPAPDELDLGAGASRVEIEADGEYVLPHLLPGAHAVRVEAPGYLAAVYMVEVHRDGQGFPLSLHPATGTPLVVTVRDDVDQPVAGASVSAYDPVTQHLAAGATDQSGIAILAPVPDLPLLIHVQRDGFQHHRPLTAFPAARPLVRLSRERPPAEAVLCRIGLVAPGDAPVTAHWALIAAGGDAWPVGSAASPVPESVLEQSLLPGEYEVLVGSGELAGSLRLTLVEPPSPGTSMRLERGVTVRLHSSGAARLSSAGAGPGGGPFDFVTAAAGADGAISLGPLPARREVVLEIHFEDGSTAYWPAPAAEPGATVQVSVPDAPNGRLTGELRSAGAGVPGASLKLHDPSRDGRTFLAVTDAEGKLSFEGVPSGWYSLHEGFLEGAERYWWPLESEVLVVGGRTLTLSLTSVTAGSGRGAGAAPAAGGGVAQQQACHCYWQENVPAREPSFCSFDRNALSDGGRKLEQEERCQKGAELDRISAHALLEYPLHFSPQGFGNATGRATELPAGTTEAGFRIGDRCYYCKPKIKGKLKVRIAMETEGANPVGKHAFLEAVAGGTLSVSGDLTGSFVPQIGASTACGELTPLGEIPVGAQRVLLPRPSCARDRRLLSASAGPRTILQDDFCIILNGAATAQSAIHGLRGHALARVTLRVEFVIVSAVCEGRCNHAGDGCPTERDVLIKTY